MKNWFPYIITLLIGFALGWWAHFLATRREAHTRRRLFRNMLRVKIADLTAVDLKRLSEGQLFERYQETITAVRDGCANIFEDIPRRHMRRFKAAWHRYLTLKREDVEPCYVTDYPPAGNDLLFPKYVEGGTTVLSLLNELILCAE